MTFDNGFRTRPYFTHTTGHKVGRSDPQLPPGRYLRRYLGSYARKTGSPFAAITRSSQIAPYDLVLVREDKAGDGKTSQAALKCEEPNCNNTYIGETSRPLKVRYKEHCRPSANGYSSAIFHHLQHNQGHSFKLESTDILDRETRWWERGVKEAIYERMYNPTLNREGGLRVDLSGTWDLALPAPRTDNT
ncbi:hypothetical protein Bbelb_215070 [Branchiostoma belcheri]|nr:hypothetical protein Bbelb_215070 [Branchiostoma belcheri]